ncbi:MAG: extracellular solute-binding protein [candidate division Zixibacteria bacterium]|nr:extracellular solute-binding protein [candidate division Zixibacteria bacterium]
MHRTRNCSKLALAAIVVFVAAMMLSCGKSMSGKTVITFWQFWTNPEVKPTVQQMIGEFERTHPQIKVQLGDLTWADGHEKIAIALAAGGGPDVIELGSDWVAEFAASGKLSDLTAATQGLTDSLRMWDPAIYQGKRYAVPWMLGTRVLFCNRTLLRQAGYDETFVPRTWIELAEAAAKISRLGDNRFGFGSNSAERHRLYKKYLPFFWSAGGEVFNSNMTATQFNSDAGRKSLEYYLRLSANGLVETQARIEDYFAAGKIGFVISGEWLVKKLNRLERSFDYFVTTMPSPGGKKPGVSFAGGEYLVVGSASKNPDMAMELIRFLVQSQNDTMFARATGSFTPVNVQSTMTYDAELTPIAKVFQQQLRNSRSTPVHPAWVSLEEALERGIEQALYKKKSPEDALQKIDSDCAAILKKYDDQ